MLNRRQLRVKVLQTLYAYNLSEDKSIKAFEKNLLDSVDDVYETYIWLLALLSETAQYALNDADERANRHIPSSEDLNVSTKINSNKFLVALRENREFQREVKKYSAYWSFDPEIIKTVYNILREKPEYEAYIASEETSIRSEKDIIKFIYKKIIKVTPAVDQVFEDKFINWAVDKEVLDAMVAKTFSNFQSEVGDENKLAKISPDWTEDRDFIVNLFHKVIAFDEEFQGYITEKTKNWEADRIALIDILLMKMALTELVYFTSIPIKVTMNEYIEIAKEFSTPKSNFFINGILDKILAELKEAGKVRKAGRGLIE